MAGNEGYWEGANWVYHTRIANEAGQGASDITWLIVPGEGNELELLYGDNFNGDTVGRVLFGIIETDTAGERVSTFIAGPTIGPAGHRGFPFADTDNATSAGARIFVAGAQRILITVEAVADGEDAALGLVCRIRGGVPTVTEGGAGTIVLTEVDERVY